MSKRVAPVRFRLRPLFVATATATGSVVLQVRPPAPVALLPDDPLLHEEAAAAAAAGFDVFRFTVVFDGDVLHLDLVAPPGVALPPTPVAAVYRGFMMPVDGYAKFYAAVAAQGLRLLESPAQYASAHWYPNAFRAVQHVSPRACWTAVDDPAAVQAADFASAVDTVRTWRCTHVVLKDYVKSAKHTHPALLRVAVDDQLADKAVLLCRARALRFNGGVVFKRWLPLRGLGAGAADSANEWRVWLANGKALCVSPNTEAAHSPATPRVPGTMVAAAEAAAAALGSPFMTVDFAEVDGGEWTCVEVGSGAVSGPALDQHLPTFWHLLASAFGAAPRNT